MIDWWVEEKDICNRAEGVALGKEFYATGIMKHGKKRLLKNREREEERERERERWGVVYTDPVKLE